MIIDTEQIYKEISKINHLLSTIDINEDQVFEERIDENNKNAILDAIKNLKEKETQLRVIRQRLEGKYFFYVNKNHLSAIMSNENEK